MTEFLQFDNFIFDFNKLNEESPYNNQDFEDNIKKEDYLNLIKNLNYDKKINLLNYCDKKEEEIKECEEFIINTFFWFNYSDELIAIYIQNEKKYFLENKKYFIKKFYNFNYDKIIDTCGLISIMEDYDEYKNDLKIFPIYDKNINIEIYQYIIEFLKYFFEHPWHSLQKPVLSTDLKQNITYKKIIKNIDKDNINDLPYWNECVQYIFYENKDKKNVDKNEEYDEDEKLFREINEEHRDWFGTWINNIYEKDENLVINILNVSNYLDIRPLLDLCAIFIATKIKLKNPEEIIQLFGSV